MEDFAHAMLQSFSSVGVDKKKTKMGMLRVMVMMLICVGWIYKLIFFFF